MYEFNLPIAESTYSNRTLALTQARRSQNAMLVMQPGSRRKAAEVHPFVEATRASATLMIPATTPQTSLQFKFGTVRDGRPYLFRSTVDRCTASTAPDRQVRGADQGTVAAARHRIQPTVGIEEPQGVRLMHSSRLYDRESIQAGTR